MKTLIIILSIFSAIMLIVAYINYAKRIHVDQLFDLLYEERNELKCDNVELKQEKSKLLRQIIELKTDKLGLINRINKQNELLKTTERLIDQNGGDRYERSLKALVNIQEHFIKIGESKKIK